MRTGRSPELGTRLSIRAGFKPPSNLSHPINGEDQSCSGAIDMHRRNHRLRGHIRRFQRTPLVKRTVTTIDTDTGAERITTRFGWWTTDCFVPIDNQQWAEQEYERRGRRS